MLKITIPGQEMFDEKTQTFETIPDITLRLEHSLISVSKWESRWRKPFLTKTNKTDIEIIDYIMCMCLDEVDVKTISRLTSDNIKEINSYISEPKTATTFNDFNENKSREIITSEIIYYSMISYNIPFECEKWHLDRLLTLIHVCHNKAAPPKKMSSAEIMARNRALNAERRAKLNSKG